MVLSITLVLSLVWCALPAFGGWSWDPIFKINGQTVKVGVELRLKEPLEDPQDVHVVLRVPRGTDARVVRDGGFDVRIVKRGRDNAAVGVFVDRDVDGFQGMTVTVTCKGDTLAETDTSRRRLRLEFELPEADQG